MRNYDHHDITILAKDSKFVGDLFFKSETKVSSIINGNVYVSKNANITIESESIINGNIECIEISIYGKVTGNIKSTGNVTIFPSGRVDGVITSKNLTIYPGAKVNIDASTDNS